MVDKIWHTCTKKLTYFLEWTELGWVFWRENSNWIIGQSFPFRFFGLGNSNEACDTNFPHRIWPSTSFIPPTGWLFGYFWWLLLVAWIHSVEACDMYQFSTQNLQLKLNILSRKFLLKNWVVWTKSNFNCLTSIYLLKNQVVWITSLYVVFSKFWNLNIFGLNHLIL